MRVTKTKALVVGAVLVLTAIGAWRLSFRGAESPRFRTVPVTRGDLDVSISATGTVEPEEVVDVGAQVAGQILSFGVDANGKTIDYGSNVEEGMVLARIDDSLYAADVAQAQAQLKFAQADFLQAQAKFAQAERDWLRAQKLGPSDALARSSYDAYQGAYETSKAGLAVSQAQIAQADAVLGKAQRNLGYCTIKSPVKGVIIDRRVNIGQTVVASLNAPSLFLIAKDLKRVQVWVAVNEADIGSISPGQPATFNVDAFPGEAFKAQVVKIRLNATMTQNVVTYTVELLTDNSSGRLLPYLTANVNFDVIRRSGVLLVPNSALRWSPKEETAQKALAGREAAAAGEAKQPGKRGRIWIASGGDLSPISVKVGVSDGSSTEVEGDQVHEGLPVVIGEVQPDSDQNDQAKSPFAPQMMRGGRH